MWCSWSKHLLSQCLAPPRCISSFRRLVRTSLVAHIPRRFVSFLWEEPTTDKCWFVPLDDSPSVVTIQNIFLVNLLILPERIHEFSRCVKVGTAELSALPNGTQHIGIDQSSSLPPSVGVALTCTLLLRLHSKE